MSERLTIPLIDQHAVREALEHLRQAEPLGENPLRHLIWVRQQIEAHTPHSSTASVEFALNTALTAIIADQLAHQRWVVGIAADGGDTREASASLLRRDFAHNNQELEAWSVLYYRYVRVDLDLQIQEIAQIAGASLRQINRRQAHGYYRLTEHLSRLETRARIESRRLWLALKLPPPSAAHLLGQDETLGQIIGIIEDAAPPHTVALIGPGGIGKTTLARAAAERLIEADHIADVTWLRLESRTPYPALLAQLAHSLGYLHLASASQIDLEASLHQRLKANPALVVIDNADWLEAYDNLLPWLERLVFPGWLLITARQQPPVGAAVHLIQVKPLSRSALIDLLRDYVRMKRLPRLPKESEMSQVIDAVGGNPLAARLVAGQLSLFPLKRVLAQLPTLETPDGEPLFDALYQSSWASLNDAARHTLLCLSVMPEEGARWQDLSEVLNFEPAMLDSALQHLARLSLVEAVGTEPCYALHALTRRFAADQSASSPWDGIYRDLLRRVTTYQSSLLSGSRLLSAVSRPDHTLSLILNQLELGEQADRLGDLAIRIAGAVRQSGQWALWRDTLRILNLQIPPTPENWNRRAHLLMEMAIAARWLGDVDDALDNFREAIRLFTSDGDLTGRARAVLEVGQLFETLGQTEPAYEAYQLAASIAEHYLDPALRRQALNGLAGLALHNDRPAQALDLLNAALTTYVGSEEPDGQTLSQFGAVLLKLGRLEDSIKAHAQALETLQEAGDLPRLARAHLRMGSACHAAGLHDEALHHLQTGLDCMRALGDAFGQARLLTNLGVLYEERSHSSEALANWQDALALQEHLHDQIGMATTLFNIADLESRLGHLDDAQAHMEEAHHLAQHVNLPSLLKLIRSHPLYNA